MFNGSRTLFYSPLSDSWTVRGAGPRQSSRVAARGFLDGRPRIELLGSTENYQYVP